MQNDKRLLSCPFCGGEAMVYTDDETKCYIIGCKSNCAVEPMTEWCETEENAIAQWNTRKPMERIVEQLESLYKYNSEQAEIYHNVEKPDAHTREMKDLYIERTNCYGVAIRTVKGGVDNAG